MSNEIKNTNAIELSEQELDVVAGGGMSSLDSFGFGLNGSVFEAISVKSGESTFAGPEGSGSKHVFEINKITSGSLKGFGTSGDGNYYDSETH